MWMNLLEFVELLFLKATLCSADLLLFLQTTAKLRDRKAVRVMIICEVKPSSKLYTARSFAGLKNTCYLNFVLFEQGTFRIRESLQIFCLRIAVPFISGINLIFNWEVIKTESSDRW